MITLFNTFTKKKEVFTPIKPGSVSMYSCGPTVYNYAHIGNLRSYIFADTTKRVLTYNDLIVGQVINITDVGHLTDDADAGEDKIEKRAKLEGKSITDITNHYTNAFLSDLTALNIDPTQITFPKASEHISEQVTLIKTLEEKGYTYTTSDGVYFDTSKYPAYGKLGSIDTQGLKEGARIEKNQEKKNITDFALWKFSTNNEKRLQEWNSPWGVGFPGWHIECSAMSTKYLGQPFDIHTGGIDHISIHHNNEIAQSEAASNTPLAHFWLHNEFITTEDSKMSKSENNFTRLQTLQDKDIHPLALRYWMLTAHYRSPLLFKQESIEASEQALFKLAQSVHKLPSGGSINADYKEKFIAAVNDDLAIPQAIALAWDLLKDPEVTDKDKKSTLLDFDRVFGFSLATLSQKINEKKKRIPPEVQRLAQDRKKLREERRWDEADALRLKIESLGYSVNDIDAGFEILPKY